MSTTREITDGTARPPSRWNELKASDQVRDLRPGMDGVEEKRSPTKIPSLAEFAHDLCSPLNALAITARCLRDERTTVADQRDNIDSIIKITERVLGIVRDVLDHARIEAASDASPAATCDLELLVSGVTDVIRPCARAKNLEFIVRWDRACPRHLRTDASRLQRILLNVLDNAVKYTVQGSVELSLHVAEIPRDPVRIWLVFEIRDTGIGILRKDQARIFERFVRGSAVAGSDGAGLGLTMASQLVHSMGGIIRVESELGTGSTFRIELPVAPALEPDSEVAPAVREGSSLPPLEGLAALPSELRAELRESVLALDVQRISGSIERVAELNGALGEHLNRLARQYAFTAIFQAIDACSSS